MDPTIIVAFIMGGLGLLGVFMTVLGNTSKTKTDARTALEERIDKKVGEYMDDLEGRLATGMDRIEALEREKADMDARVKEAEKAAEALKHRVFELETAQAVTDAREVLLYRHTKALRDHILNQLPPPPPTLPLDLTEWFEQFELGDATGSA
jgi:predicted nuclease with TOPRIM domain